MKRNEPDKMHIEALPLKNIELNKGLYITEIKNVDDAVVVYNKNADDDFWNYGYVTRLDQGLLSKIQEFFVDKKLPAAIYITEDNESEEIRNLLKKNAFKVDYEDAVMVLKREISEKEYQFTIKEVESKEDEEKYLAIYKEVFCEEGDDIYSGTSDGYLDTVKDYFKDYPRDRRFDILVMREDRAMGIASVVFDKNYAAVMGIAVPVKFRRLGISREIMQEIIKGFKDKTIFLSTEKDSVAEAIYKKMGFETVLVGKCYVERR